MDLPKTKKHPHWSLESWRDQVRKFAFTGPSSWFGFQAQGAPLDSGMDPKVRNPADDDREKSENERERRSRQSLILISEIEFWNDKPSTRFVAGARNSDAAVDDFASTLVQATLAVHAGV
jgi:hypothetical protein